MRINQNISALNAWRNLTFNDISMNKSLERLSSGLRINRAADDAAGLAISEKMRSQIKGMRQAIRNADDGISLLQSAEGALQETQSILQRIRELAIQASSATLTDADRAEIQKEVVNLRAEFDRIAKTTEFNTKKLLDGSVGKAQSAQGAIVQSVKLLKGTQAAVTGQDNFAAFDLSAQSYNRSFNIAVDGGAAKTITLDQVNLADIDTAITQIQSKIDADSDLKGKVTVDKDATGNKLVFTRIAAGQGKSVTVSGGGTQFLTGAVDTTIDAASVTGTAQVPVITKDYSAANATFSISVGGVTKTVTLNKDLSGAGDESDLLTHVQEQIDAAFSGTTIGEYTYRAGDIKVSDSDGNGADGSVTMKFELVADLANAKGVNNSFTTTDGSNTPLNTDFGMAAGTNTYEGGDDEFKITLGGGTTYTVRVDVGNYGSAAALAEAVQSGIDRVAGLQGKLSVAADTGGTKLVFGATGSAAHQTIKFAQKDATNAAAYTTGFDMDVATNLGGVAGEARNVLDYMGFATNSTGANLIATMDGSNKAVSSSDVGLTDDGANGSAAISATDRLVLATSDSGEALNLNGGSKITISGVRNGAQLSYTYEIDANTTVQNLLDQIKGTFNAAAVEVTSDGNLKVTTLAGTDNDITDVKLSVENNEYFNGKFSAFEQIQGALDARSDGSINLQIGANAGQTMNLAIDDMSARALGITGVDVSTSQGAAAAINSVNRALEKVSSERANLGALQNRLEHTIQNLQTTAENLSAAESRIRDADMALEMAVFTRNQILIQASTAMLAQANQKTQSVLQLLR